MALIGLTGCGVSSPSVLSSETPELKAGMSQEEVKAAVGSPAYQYSVNGSETWVYSKANPLVGEAKSMALNMVPVAGPLVSFSNSLVKSTIAASSAVTFDDEGKVARFEQAEEEEGAVELPLSVLPSS